MTEGIWQGDLRLSIQDGLTFVLLYNAITGHRIVQEDGSADASFEDLKAFAEQFSMDDILARHGE